MAKKRSKKRSAMFLIRYDVKELVKHIKEYMTPFQDEESSVRQSWFHDLIEWQTKVMFPNLLESNNLVDSVRCSFWMVHKGKKFDEEAYRPLAERARGLFEQLDEQHARLDQNRDVFERVRTMSHDLSDSIEFINDELKALAEDLLHQSTTKRKTSDVG
jgi:hypothetical protein